MDKWTEQAECENRQVLDDVSTCYGDGDPVEILALEIFGLGY